MENQIKSMMNNIKKAQKDLLEQDKNNIMSKMKKSSDNLLSLSKSEENLMKDPESTLNLLWQITDNLNTLYLSEESVFGNDSYKLKNLARDPTGKTKIIDVLIANDSDPAALYFKSALEFCKKAIEEIEILKNK